MPVFKTETSEIAYETAGAGDGPAFLWAHGWGQSRAAFRPLAQSFESAGRHYFIDFPGFGASPPPIEIWGTEEYADAIAQFIESEIKAPVIWIGHSFGCRVGLQMAIRRPDLIKGLCLIGGAGLRRKRTLWQNIVLYSKIYTFKTLKKLIPFGISEEWLKSKFGSPDYRRAGAIRPIMVKVNAEDMTEIVPQITRPVVLIYGDKDNETPPEIGQRLNRLIPGSEYVELSGLDHYSVLGAGRHQTAKVLKMFLEKMK